MKRKIKEDFRKKEEERLCPIVRSGKPEIAKLCCYKDVSPKKCRSNAHLGCAHYKLLKSKGLI